jgi:hypothetical protein
VSAGEHVESVLRERAGFTGRIGLAKTGEYSA